MQIQFQGEVLDAHLDGDVLVADGRELGPDAGTVELLESVDEETKERLLNAGYTVKEYKKHGPPTLGADRMSISLPRSIISWVTDAADDAGLNRSEFIRAVLAGIRDSGVSFRRLSELGVREMVRDRMKGETGR